MKTPHDDDGREMRCCDCAYDLRELAEHRCPECGRGFDPDDQSTFVRWAIRTKRVAFVSLLGLIAIVAPPAAGWKWGWPVPIPAIPEFVPTIAYSIMLAGFITTYLCMRFAMWGLRGSHARATSRGWLFFGLLVGELGVLSFLLITFVFLLRRLTAV